MGRVNRLMERRVLRRAADQALLTSLGSAPLTQPGGAPDRDFEYTHTVAEPVATTATVAHDPITEPIRVIQAESPALDTVDEPDVEDPIPAPADPVDIYDLVPDHPDQFAAEEPGRYDAERSAPTPPPLSTRALDETAMVYPAVGMAIPAYRPQPWYRAKPAAAAAAAVVIAGLVAGSWLMFRSPSTSAERSTIEAPTSAPPAPSKPAPTAASASKPAPQRQYSEPRYSRPSPTSKPRVDVTRAPMSVAPVPKPVPGSKSSTPGDTPGGRRRGCFGFC
ncbi:hypothetical protein [Mycolicibacterium agri]|nr:hypothetical protein [Mycolicibacterium agri]